MLKCILLILLVAFPVQAEAESRKLQALLNQADYKKTFEKQIHQRWQTWNQRPNITLRKDVQLLFNLTPRNQKWRNALKELLKAEFSTTLSKREKEQHLYMRLNLSYEDKALQQTLAKLLYEKHGQQTQIQVKDAHSLLNKAFDHWDAKQHEQALGRFREIHQLLKNSAEMRAILAYHLRDRGQVAEAKAVLSPVALKSDYLNWIPEMYQEIREAEANLKKVYATEQKIQASIILGQLTQAQQMVGQLPESATKDLLQARIYEKQGGHYHEATPHYLAYYRNRWQAQFPNLIPIVYKAQLEDVNSIDLIALKFRTSAELIQQVNERKHRWIESYRMLIVPIVPHQFQWPTTGYVSSHYGYRLHPLTGTWRLHSGIDIETKPGVKAQAAEEGTVIRNDLDHTCGNTVILQHRDEIQTVYCHAKQSLIKQGQQVRRGEALTETGTTGASASIHLHFGVKIKGQFYDPMDWL